MLDDDGTVQILFTTYNDPYAFMLTPFMTYNGIKPCIFIDSDLESDGLV